MLHSFMLSSSSSMSENGFREKRDESTHVFLLDWFLWHTLKFKVSRMVPPPFGLTRIVLEFVQTFESLVIWAFLWPPRFNRKGNWLGITNRAQDEELAVMCQYRSLNQYPAFCSVNITFWILLHPSRSCFCILVSICHLKPFGTNAPLVQPRHLEETNVYFDRRCCTHFFEVTRSSVKGYARSWGYPIMTSCMALCLFFC